MRTTLDLDEDLLQRAQALAHAGTKTQLVEAGLEALIREHARARLAAAGGTLPAYREPRRRRPK